MLVVVLWSNVQAFNFFYTKILMQYNATMSMFNKITYDIDNVDGYVQKETSVVFIGQYFKDLIDLKVFNLSSGYTGEYPNIFSGRSRTCYQSYFDNIMQYPILIADDKAWNECANSDYAKNMPVYPEKGSIALVDGILLVKVGY